MWTSVSVPDGVAGTRFIVVPEATKKLDKIYGAIFSQDIVHQTTKECGLWERYEINEMSPVIASVYYLWNRVGESR